MTNFVLHLIDSLYIFETFFVSFACIFAAAVLNECNDDDNNNGKNWIKFSAAKLSDHNSCIDLSLSVHPV